MGVINHLDELDIDLGILQETWIKSTDKAKIAEIKELGYDVLNRPRNGRGGGLAFIYRNDLEVKQNINIGKYKTFEVQEGTIKTDAYLIRIVNVYRPPYTKKNKNTPAMFIEEFTEYMETLVNKPGKLLMAGDFNFHVEKLAETEGNDGSLYAQKFMDILECFNLTQHVTCPTHIKGGTLDLIITDTTRGLQVSPPMSSKHGTESDHYVVFSEVECNWHSKVNVKTITYKKYSEINHEHFSKAIESSLLVDSSQFTSLDMAVDLYETTLQSIVDQYCPSITAKVNINRVSPWSQKTKEASGKTVEKKIKRP